MTVKVRSEDYGGMSPSVVLKQMKELRDRNDWLSAQVRALGGNPKQPEDPFDSLSILERVALTLALADQACQALHSVPLDPGGHHTPHPNDRGIPGSATRAARYRRNKLVDSLELAVASWENAKQHDFHPPAQDRAPSVRCRRRDCARYGRRTPAWDVRGVPNEFCSGCGERLPVPEEAA